MTKSEKNKLIVELYVFSGIVNYIEQNAVW